MANNVLYYSVTIGNNDQAKKLFNIENNNNFLRIFNIYNVEKEYYYHL